MTGSAAELKRLARLKHKKFRESTRLFLAEGEALVRESPAAPQRLLTDPVSVRKLSALTTPAGPVAVFPFLNVSAEELLSDRETVVLLDGVQDPGNVGTVVRAAHAFGAGVALGRGTADLYNPKTVRATMGSIFHAPICRGLDPLRFLDAAHDEGFVSAAAMPAGGEPPGALPLGKLVVVVGGEGAGLSEEVVSVCTMRVAIPSAAASLNAAMAASILLYEAQKRMLG